MKTLFRIFVILTCFFMLFVSCKKEEEATPTCDGKGTLHYLNNSGQYNINLIVDNIDCGLIAKDRAIEIPFREGTFHYAVYFLNGYYYSTLAKEGDVTITECEALYVSYN